MKRNNYEKISIYLAKMMNVLKSTLLTKSQFNEFCDNLFKIHNSFPLSNIEIYIKALLDALVLDQSGSCMDLVEYESNVKKLMEMDREISAKNLKEAYERHEPYKYLERLLRKSEFSNLDFETYKDYVRYIFNMKQIEGFNYLYFLTLLINASVTLKNDKEREYYLAYQRNLSSIIESEQNQNNTCNR